MMVVTWIPPEAATEFYVIEGLLFLAATVLLIAHMSRAWSETSGWGQRLRYLTLLFFSVLFTVASVEQVHQEARVNYRNIGIIIGGVLLIVTMLVSIAEYRRHQRA